MSNVCCLCHDEIEDDGIMACEKPENKCDILYQDSSWAMLEFDNVKLALVLPEQHPFHFAILKDNVEDYGKPVTHRDGSVSVYIKDRSGNNIEILRY